MGEAGGVILLWKREVVIEQNILAPKYIDVHVIESPGKSVENIFFRLLNAPLVDGHIGEG
jgi:hypothetical protein